MATPNVHNKCGKKPELRKWKVSERALKEYPNEHRLRTGWLYRWHCECGCPGWGEGTEEDATARWNRGMGRPLELQDK